MTGHDWAAVAWILAGFFVLALAFLILAIACIDDLTDQLKREKALRRVWEVQAELSAEDVARAGVER